MGWTKLRLASAGAALAVGLVGWGSAATASPDDAYVVDLNGLTFTDSTTVAGGFATDVYGYIEASTINITTQNGTIGGYHYTQSTVNTSSVPGSGDYAFYVSNYAGGLFLVLDAPPHNGTNTVDTSLSYECENSYECGIDLSQVPSNDVRYFVADSSVFIPEPSTWTLLAVPVVLAGFALRRPHGRARS